MVQFSASTDAGEEEAVSSSGHKGRRLCGGASCIVPFPGGHDNQAKREDLPVAGDLRSGHLVSSRS